jgi:hypothetical protein
MEKIMQQTQIIARDELTAVLYAQKHNFHPREWEYIANRKQLRPDTTVIVLNGWKKTRCFAQQWLLTNALKNCQTNVLYIEA